jgi:hypothetical protein
MGLATKRLGAVGRRSNPHLAVVNTIFEMTFLHSCVIPPQFLFRKKEEKTTSFEIPY